MSLAPDALPLAALAALAIAALLVGFAKTAIGGVASISVAIFAAVLPARESTGALLPLLLVGDVVAVSVYRSHARWPVLLRLLPTVGVGVVVGAAFIAVVDDTVMRRTIGAVLLGLVATHLWGRTRWARRSVQARRERSAAARADVAAPPDGVGPVGHSAARAYGLLAGFTTMVANSGGAAMSLYLLSSRLTVLGFLGTGAWFFLLVNLGKLPFSVGLGLITPDTLLLGAVLAPAVLVGAAIGRVVIARIDQRSFELAVLVLTVLAGLNLLR